MAHLAQELSSPVYVLSSTTQHHHHPENQRGELYSYDYNYNYSSTYNHPSEAIQRRRPLSKMSQSLLSDPLLLSYYQNFHDAHPFMLPRQELGGDLANCIRPEVFSIMRCIGSHYRNSSTGKGRLTMTEDVPSAMKPDGYKVQCMLLHAIIAHAEGMHMEDFAIKNGYGLPRLEEMWRRTYWELYVVESLLYGLREDNSSLYRERSDIYLPCDEVMSDKAKSIPKSYNFQELPYHWQQRYDRARGLPSFAYRVGAVHLLSSVLALGQSSPSRTTAAHVEELDNALTQLMLHACHQVREEEHGKEMIFQAQAIILSATIYLWRPRSKLTPVKLRSSSNMPIFPPSFLQATKQSPSPIFAGDLNSDPASVKLVNAATSLASLLTTQDAVNRHSPFLINAVALGMLVQLAALALLQSSHSQQKGLLHNQFVNTLGVLGRFAKSWPLAQSVRTELTQAYKDRFQDSRS